MLASGCCVFLQAVSRSHARLGGTSGVFQLFPCGAAPSTRDAQHDLPGLARGPAQSAEAWRSRLSALGARVLPLSWLTPILMKRPPASGGSDMAWLTTPGILLVAFVLAADRHAAPELEALLPTTLGGVSLTIESQAGTD